MSYDDWKTHNPDDDRCEFCGAAPGECRGGWQPNACTGECGKGSWGTKSESQLPNDIENCLTRKI